MSSKSFWLLVVSVWLSPVLAGQIGYTSKYLPSYLNGTLIKGYILDTDRTPYSATPRSVTTSLGNNSQNGDRNELKIETDNNTSRGPPATCKYNIHHNSTVLSLPSTYSQLMFIKINVKSKNTC